MDIPNACVVEMPIHKGPVLSVRFNHSGDYCLSCGADRLVKLLNPHKGLLIKTYRCCTHKCSRSNPAHIHDANIFSSGHSQDVRTAVASHDNSRLASGGNDRVPMVRARHGSIRCFLDTLLSVGGLAIMSCLQVWDVGTGQVIRHLKGFGMKVNSLLFAQDSTLMIGGSDDRSVRRHVW